MIVFRVITSCTTISLFRLFEQTENCTRCK